MENNLKKLRNEKSLSQQELANLSGVSLRTIQRIEKGESSGSPFVIKALGTTLDVDPQFILLETERVTYHPEDKLHEESTNNIGNFRMLKYLNFSALIVLIIPFANLISVPCVYFYIKKDLNCPNHRIVALKILSFQILWSITTIILMMITPLFVIWNPSFPESILEIPTFIWIYWFLLVLHLVITLINSFQINSVKNAMKYMPNLL